jgi:hypothetical protein
MNGQQGEMISRRKCLQQVAGAAVLSLLERHVAGGEAEARAYSDPRWPDFEFSYSPTLISTMSRTGSFAAKQCCGGCRTARFTR